MMRPAAKRPIGVIVDTDIGDDIDDALALAFLLALDVFDLKAVTVVHGDVAAKSRLAAKLLAMAGRDDVPVAAGASRPLTREPWLGLTEAQAGVLRPDEIFPALATQPAVELMRHRLLATDTPLTLIALGPLTNVARLIEEAPEVRGRINELVLMGGLFGRPGPEYNVCIDPEAAQIVFDSGLPMRLIPLDVGERCVMDVLQLETLSAGLSPLHRLLADLVARWQAHFEKTLPVLYDAAVVACLAAPELFTFERARVRVDISEEPFRSQTHMEPDERSLCRVCTDVQVDAFSELFGSVLLGAEASVECESRKDVQGVAGDERR